MSSALIGHTGFVGGNLLRQYRFDATYNSSNIEQIAGRHFDLIVCSGARAEKWKANQDPEADRLGIDRLWENLRQTGAAKVVLISTVDVYADPRGVNENDCVARDQATAYGRHRFDLEQRVASRFDTLVVRLPGLFGEGLRKNVIYDFLNDHDLEKIDSRAAYQFYSLSHLWPDIKVALDNGLSLVNFATEPVTVREVAREGFGVEFRNHLDRTPARYDFRSKHDTVYGGSGGYLYSRDRVLQDLSLYVGTSRSSKRCA